jgi:hypothetical protein
MEMLTDHHSQRPAIGDEKNAEVKKRTDDLGNFSSFDVNRSKLEHQVKVKPNRTYGTI